MGVTALGLAPCPQRIEDRLRWDGTSRGPRALLVWGTCPLGFGYLRGWDSPSPWAALPGARGVLQHVSVQAQGELHTCNLCRCESLFLHAGSGCRCPGRRVRSLFIGKRGSFPRLYSFGSRSRCINQVWFEQRFGRLHLQVGYCPSICSNYFLTHKIC